MNFENLPKKDHYLFKEITSITGVKPYVLRFWESEFPQISPERSQGGDKLYTKNDLLCVEKIRDLLFEDKLSIPQAKMYLDKEIRNNGSTTSNVEETSPEPREFSTEPPKIMYSGVETRASIGSLFLTRPSSTSSVEDLQLSLKEDLDAHKEVLFKKQFNDQDVLRLVQAKKKLASILSKIDTIIKEKHWS